MEGVPGSQVKDELIAIAARREELDHQRQSVNEPPPLLHPQMADVYRTKVTQLARALQEPESRPEATEALRGLVDAIVLTPDQGRETLRIELKRNLAAMLGATARLRAPQRGTARFGASAVASAEAEKTKRSPESDDLSL